MKNGILFIDKTLGLTSRAVDNALQKKFETRHVGHLGTLDPFATGLLLVGVGTGTKFLPYLDETKKSYIASLELGSRSSTGDPEGDIVSGLPVPALTLADIVKKSLSLIGDSLQTPPLTSAIKVRGKPLYRLAHQGIDYKPLPRPITVYSLHVISYADRQLLFTCTVSPGTYIRVLGEDLAKALGTVGYLTSLRRTSIGPFLVALAKTTDKISEADILNPTVFVTTMKHVEIDTDWLNKVHNGQPLVLPSDYGEKVLLVLHGEALAVYRRDSGTRYVSERGLW